MNVDDFDLYHDTHELARTSYQDRSFVSGLWEKTLQRLLTVMVKLRGSHSSLESSSLVNGFVLLTVYMSINVLQLLSLATSCDLDSQEFVFWSGLRYVRLDWIAHKTASLWAFTTAAQIVIMAQACLLGLAVASVSSLSKLHDIAVKGLRLFSHPSFSVVIIPFQMALLTTIKYTTSPKTTILEYEDLPVDSLGANSGTCLLSLLCYFALLALELVKLVLDTQIGYSPNSQSSRFTTSFDTRLRLGFSSLVVLYLFTELMHPIVYRGVTIGLSLYLAYILYEAAPYRLRMMNYLHFALCFFLAWAVVAVQIGELLSNSFTSFLLMSLVVPFLLPSVLNVFKERLNKAEAKAGRRISNTSILREFEFNLRVVALAADTDEKHSRVLDHFFAFRDRCKDDDKMLDILLVYFCIDVKKDNRLALVKLGRLQRPGFSFEARFHESYIRDYLSTCKDLGEEYEYLEFKTKFDQIKRLDEEVTVASYKLWHEISLKSPSTESIDQYLTFVYENATNVRLGYEDIMRRFREAKGVVELFTGFVTTVISEEESNAIKLAFARLSLHSKHEQKSLRNLTFFKDSYGVMLVDANPDNFAKITYANEAAAQLFGVPRSVFIGSDLDDFIPPPANRNHVKKMLNFVRNSKNTNVDLPFNVFIYGSNKYLMDCRIIVRLTALDTHPVFVVSVIDLPNTRDVAIVDDDGMIYSHSQRFPQVLNQHLDRLDGKYIEDLLPIDFKNLELFKAYEVRTPNQVVKLASAILSVHQVSLKLLFIFTDNSEFLRWKQGRHKQDIEDLTTLHRISEDIIAIELIEEATPKVALRAKVRSKTIYEQAKPTKFKENEEDQLLIEEEELGSPVRPRAASQSSKTFTASKEIENQSKGLGVFMTALKVSRNTTLISTLMLALGSIAMLIYLIVSVGSVDQVFMLKMFSSLSYDFIISGFASRLLMQARESLVLYDVDKVHDILAEVNTDLRDQLSSMNDNRALISAYGFDYLFDNELIRSWLLENGEPRMRSKNLVDVTEEFIVSTQVAVTLSVEDCSIKNDHLYYSYRNGLGESFDLMNSTTYQYLHNQRGFMGDVENGLLAMFGVCGGILMACVLMVVPSLVYLQRSNDEFWGKLTALKNQKALDLKFNLIRRIHSNFEPEIIEDLEAYTSSDLRQARRGNKPLPKLKFTIWRRVALKLSLFVVLSGLLFAVFYAVCFINIRDTLNIYYEQAYYSNQIKLTFLSSVVWSEEHNFKQQGVDSDVPSYLYSETHAKVVEENAKLKTVMTRLVDSKYSIVEFDKKSMLRSDFGSTTPHFHHGTQQAVVNLYQDLIFHEETPFATEDFKDFTRISLELVVYLDEIYDSIIKATEANVSTSIGQATTVIICYTLGTLMLSFGLYKHMFDALAAKLERNMSVIRLILD